MYIVDFYLGLLQTRQSRQTCLLNHPHTVLWVLWVLFLIKLDTHKLQFYLSWFPLPSTISISTLSFLRLKKKINSFNLCFYQYFLSLPLSLLFLLSSSSCSATISILGWNCKIKLIILLYYLWLPYLVVVEEVHEDFHDAWDDHQYGGCNEEGVDVVKWPILLFFGSCKHL